VLVVVDTVLSTLSLNSTSEASLYLAPSGVEAHEDAITPANGYNDSVLITRNGHGPTDRPKNMWG